MTVRSHSLALFYETVCPKLFKDILNDLCVLGRWGLAEYIKAYPEPVVDVLMDFVVFRTQGGRIDAFFQGFCFASGAILILSTCQEIRAGQVNVY